MINFANAGEVNEETAEAAEHFLSDPFISLPIFIIFVIALYFVLKALKVSSASIMLTELIVFFIVGVAAYSLVPVVSIFALSVGIGAALFITLAALANH